MAGGGLLLGRRRPLRRRPLVRTPRRWARGIRVGPQALEHQADHARPPPVGDRTDLPRPGLPRPEGPLPLGEPLVRGDPLGPVRRLR